MSNISYSFLADDFSKAVKIIDPFIDDRDRDLLESHLVYNMKRADVALKYGISRGLVSRIINRFMIAFFDNPKCSDIPVSSYDFNLKIEITGTHNKLDS